MKSGSWLAIWRRVGVQQKSLSGERNTDDRDKDEIKTERAARQEKERRGRKRSIKQP